VNEWVQIEQKEIEFNQIGQREEELPEESDAYALFVYAMITGYKRLLS
jgi:hypothetical protein